MLFYSIQCFVGNDMFHLAGIMSGYIGSNADIGQHLSKNCVALIYFFAKSKPESVSSR